VADAKRDQKIGAWQRIHDARQVVEQANEEVALQSSGQKTAQNVATDGETKEDAPPVPEPEKQRQTPEESAKRRPHDFLDDLLAQEDQAS